MGLNIIRTDSVSALVAKQPLLTGQPGQVVGFDGMGLAYAVRGWSSQNLLDNWYFPDPINQRGVSGTITTPGYFIDRWKLVSGSVTIAEGGLLLNGTIAQILEDDPGQEVTASYLTDGGVIQAEYDSETRTFAITAEGVLIRAAKLEPGAQQTLARQDAEGSWALNDPPPNKALELAKCQRYLYTGEFYYPAEAAASFLPIYLQFPVEMRVKPSCKVYAAANKNDEGKLANFLTGRTISDVDGVYVNGASLGKNVIGLLGSTTGFPQNQYYGYIVADANL